MTKNRMYGVPESLGEVSQSSGNFQIYFKREENIAIDDCINNLVSSSSEAKYFLENPAKYLNEKGLSNIKLDANDSIFNNLRITANKEVSAAVTNRDAKRFVSELTKMQLIPKQFILSSKDPKPLALAAPVAVAPAVVYTSLGVVGTAVAVVAAAVYLGVKLWGSKFQDTEWKSIKLDESIAQTLALATLLADTNFAKEVDRVIYSNFKLEAEKLFNKFKHLVPKNHPLVENV